MQKKVLDTLEKINITAEDIELKTVSSERGHSSFATVVTRNDKVYKVPLHPEGIKVLELIVNNHKLLGQNGLSVVPLKIIDGVGVMDRIKYPTIAEYVKECVTAENKSHIFTCVDKVYQDIFKTSKKSQEIDRQFIKYGNQNIFMPVLKDGFTEILPQNAFYTCDHIIYFDQESREKDIPAGYIFARFIRHLFYEVPMLHFVIPLSEFWARYECIGKPMWKIYSKIAYARYTLSFDRIVNEQELSALVGEMVIIGSGNWCMIFLDILEQCGRLNDVKEILDNDESKWKKKVYDIPISAIDGNIEKKGNFNIMIAIKERDEVVKQIKRNNISFTNIYLLKLVGYKIRLERYTQ